jgi:hypothetical protein
MPFKAGGPQTSGRVIQNVGENAKFRFAGNTPRAHQKTVVIPNAGRDLRLPFQSSMKELKSKAPHSRRPTPTVPKRHCHPERSEGSAAAFPKLNKKFEIETSV